MQALEAAAQAEHLAFLEDFGGDIAPRAVIVFISIDDFNRAERSPLYRFGKRTHWNWMMEQSRLMRL